MAQLCWLSGQQLEGIRPFFAQERGVKRVDAPSADGSHKIPYNRCRRWSDNGVFDLIFSE